MTREIDETIERFTSNAEYERTHGNLQGSLEFKQLAEWLKDYKRLKEQEPKWIPVSERLPKRYDSHDLIHRETARRIIDSPRTKEQMLMVLASAENQKKTGHWVYEPRKRLINETDEGREYITEYWCKCSECGGDFGFQKMSDAYCKYCGARMEVEQNG